jgi:hypothetical protein
MTIFEYLMVMVSIVLALALAQLLRGITEIVTNPNRYWIHTAWVAMMMLFVVQYWWAYWDFSAVSSWTLLRFVYVLLAPVLLFLSTYLLLPVYRPKDPDWQVHFFSIRFWLFLTLIAASLVGTLGSWVLLGASLLHPYRVFQAMMLALLVVGLISKKHRVHGPLVIVYMSVFLISQIVIRMNIGALASTSP